MDEPANPTSAAGTPSRSASTPDPATTPADPFAASVAGPVIHSAFLPAWTTPSICPALSAGASAPSTMADSAGGGTGRSQIAAILQSNDSGNSDDGLSNDEASDDGYYAPGYVIGPPRGNNQNHHNNSAGFAERAVFHDTARSNDTSGDSSSGDTGHDSEDEQDYSSEDLPLFQFNPFLNQGYYLGNNSPSEEVLSEWRRALISGDDFPTVISPLQVHNISMTVDANPYVHSIAELVWMNVEPHLSYEGNGLIADGRLNRLIVAQSIHAEVLKGRFNGRKELYEKAFRVGSNIEHGELMAIFMNQEDVFRYNFGRMDFSQNVSNNEHMLLQNIFTLVRYNRIGIEGDMAAKITSFTGGTVTDSLIRWSSSGMAILQIQKLLYAFADNVLYHHHRMIAFEEHYNEMRMLKTYNEWKHMLRRLPHEIGNRRSNPEEWLKCVRQTDDDLSSQSSGE